VKTRKDKKRKKMGDTFAELTYSGGGYQVFQGNYAAPRAMT
jgi:hypothetical protein